MYNLFNIADTVQKYAKITAEIAKVEVEVVDDNLVRVAGTGIFSEINVDVSENSHVYKHAIKTGERQVVLEPRKDERCKECKIKDECKELLEISMPIKIKGKIIGVIGMASTTEESKNILVNNLSSYLEFLNQIADFIATKALEDEETKNRIAMMDVLESIIRSMDEGAIVINNQGNVEIINKSAKNQLGITRTINNERIEIKPTGDTVSHGKEYNVRIGKHVRTVVGDIFKLPKNPFYKQVLLFRDLNKVHSNIYAMTSTVNVVSADKIDGSSKKILELKEKIKRVANSPSTVLITGESGVGKEVVATAIWQNSDRRNNRFVAINCAAIPESLLESELFGYVKGAFTGADPNGKIGKFELANHGIIFLDEIGDMPLYLQTKLLRVIQERKIARIGSNQLIPLDVRIIAATNKDLKKMIRENKFREDLYYRLNVIPIEIPPLRERKEDIKDLVYHFINHYCKLFSKNFVRIEDETMEILMNYPWYGNVRELENTVEFIVNMMEDGVVNNNTLPADILKFDGKEYCNEQEIRTLKEVEGEEIKKALDYYGHSTEGKRKAAKALGIGIATLYRKLREN